MSIRDRLRASYVAMLVIPITLSVLAAVFIAQIYIRQIEAVYDTPFTERSIREFMDKDPQLVEKVRQISQGDPNNIADLEVIQNLDIELSKVNAGIVIGKNNEIIYTSELFQHVEFDGKLQKFGSFIKEKHERVLIDNKIHLIKQHDFYFEDGSFGSVYFIINMSFVANNFRSFIITLLLVIVAIIILTNGILTLAVSRSILNPLKALEEATNQIKKGNLDFEVQCHSKDEIGQLCDAFEDMRLKLKDSIEVQLQYEKNRNELMSNISHDLKTPVTAIKGYVEGIMDGVADSPEKKERYIKTIYTKASDMDRLIDELLLYSKLDIKRLPFHFEKVNMVQFLGDLMEELQFDLEGKGIKLQLYEDKNIPLVLADREKLKRVIGNVIDNAVKYMNKEDGRIEVHLIKSNGKKSDVLIEIKDNGQGIPQEFLPFIFDRFYRVDPSRNINTGGSGLGLAIAKRIIEEHGGSIWATSEVNKGTSIFFTLNESTENNRGEIDEENFNY